MKPLDAQVGLVAIVVALASASSASAQEANVDAKKAAAKASPGDASTSLALGRTLRRAGRTQEAVAELTRGLGLGSASKNNLAQQIAWELVRARTDQHDAKTAMTSCDALGKFTPISNACRAEVFLAQNRATEGLPLAQKALAADASIYEAKVAEGRAFFLEGKPADGEASLKAAIGMSDARVEAHRWLGTGLLNVGDRDKGIAELKVAEAKDGDDPDVAVELGLALGSTKEGRAELERAMKIRPTDASTEAALAKVDMDLGDATAAEGAAQTALRLDSTKYEAHLVLARVKVAQQKWDDAVKEGEEAKKHMPNAAGPVLAIADGQAGKGDIDLAIASYQSAFGLDRTDPAPLVRAAKACLANNRPTTARGFADKATTEFPKWAPAWVGLGEVAEKQGDKARAKAAYETALKSDGPIDKDAIKKRIDALR